jgi:predicted PurR-regulated permease PerM
MNLSPAFLKALAWAGVAAVSLWLMQSFAPVLAPFVVAFAMAYLLHPLVERLSAWRLPRPVAVCLALLLLALALALLVLLIVPVFTRQIPLLKDQIPALVEVINAQLLPLNQYVGTEVAIDVEAVRQMLRTALASHETDLINSLLASAKVGGSALIALLGGVVLTPVLAFYLLMDWERVLAMALAWVPLAWKEPVRHFFRDTDHVLGRYLRGQGRVMLALAVWYAVALWAVGLKLALPIGLFTGLAVFVPYLGFGLGLVMAILAATLQFQAWLGVALVAAVYAAGQLIESFWLTPRYVGEAIGLNPIAVIFALMAFGHVMGFIGVLIALPASAVLVVALRRLQAAYKTSALYQS